MAKGLRVNTGTDSNGMNFPILTRTMQLTLCTKEKRHFPCFCNFISREVLVGFDMVSMLLNA